LDTTINNQTEQQLPDPMIGTILPRHYKITGKLGRGAMSVVYEGVYEPLGQPVAIKLLKSHLVSDEATFRRFQQEAKTAGALEHPNIVGILDFGITDQGVPYLIMELLHGVSLIERLRQAPPVDLLSLISLFLQVGDALSYTHERGIVHRDVKPSNIVVVNEYGKDVVKIVDFGIAKLQTLDGQGNGAHDLTATGEVFGTPLYVSPEQAMGRTIDERADIYSLGCVLYEAIAGKPAFNAPTAFDVIRMQITTDPIPLDAARPDLKLPPSLLQVVDRSMLKDPDDRYQTLRQMMVDMREALKEARRGIYGRNAARPLGPPVSSSRVKTVSSTSNAIVEQAPNAVARQKRRLPIMLFLIVWVSGCLSGVLVLFCLDFKQKLELATVPTEQMVVTPSATGVRKQDGPSWPLLETASTAIGKQQYGVAQEALGKVIPQLEKSGDGQKENLANAYNMLGISYYYMRDPAKAEPYLQKAYALDKQLSGPESAACAGDLTNLARVTEMQRKLDTAEQYYRDSLAISEKIYGPTDQKLGNRIENLGAFLHRRHKTVEAASLRRRAREILDRK
jgi:serine/threonine protein kinase